MGQWDSLKGSVIVSNYIYILYIYFIYTILYIYFYIYYIYIIYTIYIYNVYIVTDCFCHQIATLKEKRTCVITNTVKSQSVYDFTRDCLATMCYSISIFKGGQISVKWFEF